MNSTAVNRLAQALDLLREASNEIPVPKDPFAPEVHEIGNSNALRHIREAMGECLNAMEVLTGGGGE